MSAQNAQNGRGRKDEDDDDGGGGGVASPTTTTALVEEMDDLKRNNSRDGRGDVDGAGVVSPTTAAAAVRVDDNDLLHVLNEQDDADLAMQWLFHGKIDAKHFAKVLPHTTQDLRDGKTSPEKLLEKLSLALSATLKIRTKDGSFVGTNMELVANRLASKTVLEFWCRDEEQKRWLARTHLDFAGDIFRRCQYMDQIRIVNNIVPWKDIALPIHKALKETCEEWERKVDDVLFKGRLGTFLFFCPTYKLSPQEAAEMVRDIISLEERDEEQFLADHERIRVKKKQLKLAVRVVADGAHEALKSCWECGAVPTAGDTDDAITVVLACCSKCKVAQYCSRKCQRDAWLSGHRRKCETLNEKHDAFFESVEVVEEAHESGGMLEGTKLSCFDYNLTADIFLNPCPLFPSLNQEMPALRGPSMKLFYENFARVLRGEWWFYSDTDSLEDYYSKVSPTGSNDYLSWDVDRDHFHRLLLCLSFDIAFFVASLLPDVLGEYVEFGEGLKAVLFDQFLVQQAGNDEKANRVAMPAERFIHLYKYTTMYNVELEDNAKARSRAKSDAKALTMQHFRKNYHK